MTRSALPTPCPRVKTSTVSIPSGVPTKVAWNVGKKMADDLVADYRKKHGHYPDKIALILWATETLRHHGVMESKALALLGARPVWDGRGIIQEVELIPESELNRPRIDILVNSSGLYRDVFPIQIGLIDDAVQLVIAEEKGKYENFARLHTLEAEKLFMEKGYSKKMRKKWPVTAFSGPPTRAYGTGLGEAIPASGSWEDDKKLADLYINRLSFAYGEKYGAKSPVTPSSNRSKDPIWLFTVARPISSASWTTTMSTNTWEAWPWLSAILPARSLSFLSLTTGTRRRREKSSISPNFLGLKTRGRYLNPKWITGMKEHGYSGAHKMADFVENLWGWQVTTPKEVTEEIWRQVDEVYVKDKYNLGLKEFFEKNSPHAYQSLTARLMEVDRKGYQKFDKEMLQKLAAEYVESVVEQGDGLL